MSETSGFRAQWARIQAWPPAFRLAAVLAFFFFGCLAVGAGGSLANPWLLVLIWTLVSLECRTLSLASLISLGILGLVVLLPVSAVLELPLAWAMLNSPGWASGIAAGVEAGLILLVLLALTLVPKSRLRFTGSILDYTLAGLWMAAGLEWGVGLLLRSSPGFLGMPLGGWPQLPGLLGKTENTAACSSPAVWGLALGLIIGLGRYFTGPDFKRRGGRIWMPLGLASFLGWVVLEHAAYSLYPNIGELAGFYGFSLEGRALTYAFFLGAGLTTAIETLWFQASAPDSRLKRPLAEFLQAGMGKKDLAQSLARWSDCQKERSRVREEVVAVEISPLLENPEKADRHLESRQNQETSGRRDL